MAVDRVTIINVEAPENADLNAELQWLGATLGLFGRRDKDSSCFRIFITLVRAAQHEKTLSSDQIAQHCKLSRGTVVHHLNRLRDTGLIQPATQGYRLSATSMEESLNQLENELQDMISLMRAVAKDIDKKLS